jgi:hypothetical protein
VCDGISGLFPYHGNNTYITDGVGSWYTTNPSLFPDVVLRVVRVEYSNDSLNVYNNNVNVLSTSYTGSFSNDVFNAEALNSCVDDILYIYTRFLNLQKKDKCVFLSFNYLQQHIMYNSGHINIIYKAFLYVVISCSIISKSNSCCAFFVSY